MSIYRTGNSPFWHVRIYDNLRKRYIVRSSKEKARLTAKEVAEELFDEHRSKKNQAVAVSRDTSFRHYAEKLQAHEKAMAARMRGKRFFTDTRAILAPTVRKGSKEKRIGMLEYFGEYDVSKITAGMVREYFQKVDEKRDTPLAASTKAKHGMVMRKVLTLAYEDGLIDSLPPMPKNRVKDNPRTSFSEAEYKHLLTVTRECIERGDMVRNTPVPWDMYYLIVMLVHTFMRPTESEIFAIRHCDVTVKDNPRCLHIMANGKTGTPISQDDRDTQAVFGEYVSIYDIQQAVDDGATVPIYYESRLAKINLDHTALPTIDDEVEDILESETADEREKERAKSQWSALEAIVGTDARLQVVAEDLIKHYETRSQMRSSSLGGGGASIRSSSPS